MAYVVKIATVDSYWTGDENAVWSDDQSKAATYSTKKAVDAAIKEINESWPYTLVAESV